MNDENKSLADLSDDTFGSSLTLDLHIKATSPEEAEKIASAILCLHQVPRSSVGTGVEEGSYRVRTKVCLNEPIAANCIVAIYVDDELNQTRNALLDAGWKTDSPRGLLFSHEMPKRSSAITAPKTKAAESTSWLAKLLQQIKGIFGPKQ